MTGREVAISAIAVAIGVVVGLATSYALVDGYLRGDRA